MRDESQEWQILFAEVTSWVTQPGRLIRMGYESPAYRGEIA
jgi:hypothetical protein